MRFLAGALLLLFVCLPQSALPFTSDEINALETGIKGSPVGVRVAWWAEQFIGTAYDTDPLGDYVRRSLIVADERVDCMYLTFRSVELALSDNAEGAVDKALVLRFHTRGLVKDGKVINYDERYQDGIDMIASGKYGLEITATVGKTREFAEPKSGTRFDFLPPSEIHAALHRLNTGDILYFVRDPARTQGGLIAHMGIIKIETRNDGLGRSVYLIHASGTKKRGGSVKKVLLDDYLSHMQHAGAKISRLSEAR